jgi:23S rRNA pseudouridine955/2504/2580 synthase
VKNKKSLVALIVQKDDDGKRFDKIIRKVFPAQKLSSLYSAIRKGEILLNQKKAKHFTKVFSGDMISYLPHLQSPLTNKEQKPIPAFDPQQREFLKSITIFENQDVLVLNKPRGYLVHGQHSLTSLVENYWLSQQKYSLSFKPGPVHRLDRNTTGLKFFALSIKGARLLTLLFRQALVKKVYITLVCGKITKKQVWVDWIARDTAAKQSFVTDQRQGKKAVTQVIPIGSKNNISCLLCLPETGRTHQIRLQAQLHKHPLIGDRKYGYSSSQPYYILHAGGIHLSKQGKQLDIPPLFAPLPPYSEDIFISYLSPNILKEAYAQIEKIIKALAI